MEEKEKKQNAVGKFIEDHPIVSFMTLFLILDFTKDVIGLWAGKEKGE